MCRPWVWQLAKVVGPPGGDFWAVLRKKRLRLSQYDSAGNLPAHQALSLPGLQPRVASVLCSISFVDVYLEDPLLVRVWLSTCFKKQKLEIGQRRRNASVWQLQCSGRMWVRASYFVSRPPVGVHLHGVCVRVCLLYPPKATADYTCDCDGVPENPEPRAYTNTCAKEAQYCLLEMARHATWIRI
jgi:hypothetical protein